MEYKNKKLGWKYNHLKAEAHFLEGISNTIKRRLVDIYRDISKEKKENLVFAISFIAILYSLTGISSLFY